MIKQLKFLWKNISRHLSSCRTWKMSRAKKSRKLDCKSRRSLWREIVNEKFSGKKIWANAVVRTQVRNIVRSDRELFTCGAADYDTARSSPAYLASRAAHLVIAMRPTRRFLRRASDRANGFHAHARTYVAVTARTLGVLRDGAEKHFGQIRHVRIS